MNRIRKALRGVGRKTIKAALCFLLVCCVVGVGTGPIVKAVEAGHKYTAIFCCMLVGWAVGVGLGIAIGMSKANCLNEWYIRYLESRISSLAAELDDL